ncbi:cuticle protein 19-like [Trichoplusia ni]|uniref:Cuticle protein 19-like n=1 Tax=Trichoplusia ni TaxID=7111 RepID=A0A7E5WH57_TRINI|nr:cuticle protein 19-like [Trichoplusia ni]
MDFVYLKMVWLLNSWLFASGAPVAMLQHATSSQSIVFHQLPAAPAAPVTTPTPVGPSSSGSHAKYEYKYEVSDHQTGDRKSHWESRDGDKVRGVYTLYEPDGALRTVEYTADALHGFNAVVRRNEPNKHSHLGAGYKPDVPVNTVHSYDETGPGYAAERGTYPVQNTVTRRQGKPNQYNQGVEYSVDHGRNPDKAY